MMFILLTVTLLLSLDLPPPPETLHKIPPNYSLIVFLFCLSFLIASTYSKHHRLASLIYQLDLLYMYLQSLSVE